MSVGHGPVDPQTLPFAWGMDLWSGLPVLLLASVGAVGLRRMGPRSRRRAMPWFVAGLLTTGLALFSPLDALSDALFSAHMVQHLLLIGVAATLLAVAPLEQVGLAALPRGARRRVIRLGRGPLGQVLGHLTAPISAFVLHTAAILLWHTPALYGLALRDPAAHAAEHASFLGTGILFWRAVGHPSPRRRAAPLTAVGMLFGMGLIGGVLGALIAFSPRPWIPEYARTTGAFGLSPLADQQLAGAIMWVPAGFGYAAAALWVLQRALSDLERSSSLASPGQPSGQSA